MRSTFINMALGKARFWAKKLANFRRSKFRVKSLTAVVGVRGSEWIQIVTKVPAPLAANEEVIKVPALAANEDATRFSTRVIALEDTILEVVSTAAPEELPVILKDFEQIEVLQDEVPFEKEMAPSEIIEQHLRDVRMVPGGKVPEGTIVPEKGITEKKEGVKDEGVVVDSGEDKPQIIVKVYEPELTGPGVGTPEEFEEDQPEPILDLEDPELPGGGSEPPPPPEYVEEIKEDIVKSLPLDEMLPGMPPTPPE
jgi:hypothetical protein